LRALTLMSDYQSRADQKAFLDSGRPLTTWREASRLFTDYFIDTGVNGNLRKGVEAIGGCFTLLPADCGWDPLSMRFGNTEMHVQNCRSYDFEGRPHMDWLHVTLCRAPGAPASDLSYVTLRLHDEHHPVDVRESNYFGMIADFKGMIDEVAAHASRPENFAIALKKAYEIKPAA